MLFPTSFKPMLASPFDPVKAKFPLLVSPKLDGIRCLVSGSIVVSRNMKPIPNNFIRSQLYNSGNLLPLDGELITYTDGKLDDFSTIQSKVMSASGEPDFLFHVFDCVSGGPFRERLNYALRAADQLPNYFPVQHETVTDLETLHVYEQSFVDAGFEGAMTRNPEGVYKYGRSTVNEGSLLKMKRFYDTEAIVIDYTERMHNANEQTRDELGRAKRSSHKANMVPTGMLGSLVCLMPSGVEFEIGTGFTEAQRKELWIGDGTPMNCKTDHLLGRIVKYKYQELGPNGAPRFPVFLSFREDGAV